MGCSPESLPCVHAARSLAVEAETLTHTRPCGRHLPPLPRAVHGQHGHEELIALYDKLRWFWALKRAKFGPLHFE